ncbi:MAG: GNAT family N-acetyltransferase [Leptolyngbya sp. SIOISBB]|nr:GNAT family N-acetyltransferase [Leptolyngbya sp. SIOISBB]
MIKTTRLRIRRFIPQDREPFIQFMTDRESTRFLTFGAEQKTREGAIALLEATIASYDSEQPMLAFAIATLATGTFVGFCGLHPHDQATVEIMYAILPQARRQGYATEVAAAITRWALTDMGYRRAIAPIDPAHPASQAVVIKAGFTDCGLVQNPASPDPKRLFVFEQEAIGKV